MLTLAERASLDEMSESLYRLVQGDLMLQLEISRRRRHHHRRKNDAGRRAVHGHRVERGDKSGARKEMKSGGGSERKNEHARTSSAVSSVSSWEAEEGDVDVLDAGRQRKLVQDEREREARKMRRSGVAGGVGRVRTKTAGRMVLLRVTADLLAIELLEPYTRVCLGRIPFSELQRVMYGVVTDLPVCYEPWLVFTLVYSTRTRPRCTMHLQCGQRDSVFKWLLALQKVWAHTHYHSVGRSHQLGEEDQKALMSRGSLLWEMFKVRQRVFAERQGLSLFKYLAVQGVDRGGRRVEVVHVGEEQRKEVVEEVAVVEEVEEASQQDVGEVKQKKKQKKKKSRRKRSKKSRS